MEKIGFLLFLERLLRHLYSQLISRIYPLLGIVEIAALIIKHRVKLALELLDFLARRLLLLRSLELAEELAVFVEIVGDWVVRQAR